MCLRGCFWHEGSNGLGVGPVWLRRWLPCRKAFDTAARMHDECYDTQGDGDMRKMADYVFLFEMLKACYKPWQRGMAYVYFGLVRGFGWMFYRYEK